MKPWIKLWKNDLLSSLNYQWLSIFQKGIYHQLLLLCRDDEYGGQLCWPNGNPLSTQEIIHAMRPSQGDRTDKVIRAIEEMVRKGLLFWNERKCLEIRNYKEKTEQGLRNRHISPTSLTTSLTTSPIHAKKTLKNQDSYKPLYSDTEADKERKAKQSQIRELFDRFWLVYPRKVAKQKALIRWISLSKKYGREFISITVPCMFKALEKQKLSKQWMKDGGEFIPHPASWLNQERWNDEIKDKEDWRDG